MIRLVLADDQTLVRKGIRGLLELVADVRVVAEAGDGEEALRAIEEHRPEVALLDVRMPGLTGVEVAAKAREKGLSARVILLTTFDDDGALKAGIAAGIHGFLLKDVSLDELAEGIRRVAAGETLIQPTVTERARATVKEKGVGFDAHALPDPLTPREIEVLRLIASGMSNREVADSLGVAEGTVKNHASNVLSKLGVRDRTRAVLRALELGLL